MMVSARQNLDNAMCAGIKVGFSIMLFWIIQFFNERLSVIWLAEVMLCCNVWFFGVIIYPSVSFLQPYYI